MDATTTASTEGNGFIKEMASFPCMFNIGMMHKRNQVRIKLMIDKLDNDIKENMIVRFENEKLMKLNALTWLYVQAGDIKKATEANDLAIQLTFGTNCLAALGNQAFLTWFSGGNVAANLQKVQALRSTSNFQEHSRGAQAEQAYFLYRLGGKYNLSLSSNMYDNLVQWQPDNYQMKYYHGLVCRRLDVIHREQREKTTEIFEDIALNAKDRYTKSLALSELATVFAFTTKSTSTTVDVEELAKRAVSLTNDCPTVYKNCGIALNRLGNGLKAIDYLKSSISLHSTSTTHHALGKCYRDYSQKGTTNRDNYQERAIDHLREAYQLATENTQPLLDLVMLLNQRKEVDFCFELCDFIIQSWALDDVHQNPFHMAKFYDIWYQLSKKLHGKRGLKRHMLIALSTTLEYVKLNMSPEEQKTLFLQIVRSSGRNQSDKRTKNFFYLLRGCEYDTSVVQIIRQSHEKGKLHEEGSVEAEINALLEDGKSDEAVVIINILDLLENNNPIVSKEVRKKALLDEATRQLEEGLIACKLLFYNLFHTFHLGQHHADLEIDKQFPKADILLLHDGPEWKHLVQNNVEGHRNHLDSILASKVYDELLKSLFDLEIVSNPWIPLSRESSANTFMTLVEQYNVKLVLVLVDANSSEQFLQLVDGLLGPIVEGLDVARQAAAAAAHPAATTTSPDVAIICSDGRDVEAVGLPNLSQVRQFQPQQEGLRHLADSKPVDQLQGTEILDAYFSGSAGNAVNFFKFLLPRNQ